MVSTGRELDAAFALFAKNRVEAVLITQNPLFNTIERKRILELAATQRVPLIGTGSSVANDGALLSYGVLQFDLIRRSAQMVDRILKGAKPTDIPVEQPTKFELVINLKAAKALGLTIPQSILVRADKVIE
jgi:putative ABC transport system substrate-binding protein